MEFKVLPVRFDLKTYEKVHNIAHAHGINKSDIIRHAVDDYLNNPKKLLTKRDIAV
jgi:predicted DNA-binding protein